MHHKPFTIFKPSYPAGIDQGHPLAKGLVFLIMPTTTSVVDLVSGIPGTAGGSGHSVVQDVDGQSLRLNAAPYYEWAARPEIDTIGPVSMFFRGTVQGVSPSGNVMSRRSSATSANHPGGWLVAHDTVGFYRGSANGFYGFTLNSVPSYPWFAPRSLVWSTSSGDVRNTPLCWLDGVLQAITGGYAGGGGTGNAVTNTAALRVGGRPAGDLPFNGTIGLLGMWNRPLDARDAQELTLAPYSIFRRSRWRRGLISSSPIALVGDAVASASATGALSTGIKPAGNITAVSSTTGALTTNIQTAGAIAAQAAVTGGLSTGIQVAGNAASAATMAGVLSTEIRLAAGATTVAASTGELTTAIRLAGSAGGVSTLVGEFPTDVRLAGSAASASEAVGDLTTGLRLAGSVAATGTATGNLTTGVRLSGSVPSLVTVAGALTTEIRFAGAITAVASMTANLSTDALSIDYPRHVEFPADRRLVLFPQEIRSARFPPDRRRLVFPEDR